MDKIFYYNLSDKYDPETYINSRKTYKIFYGFKTNMGKSESCTFKGDTLKIGSKEALICNSNKIELSDIEKSLLSKQKLYFDDIIIELNQNNGKKINHWIWWVFPTEKQGASEPFPKTNILLNRQSEYIIYLARNEIEILQKWILIINILKELPDIDRGRVKFFYEEWKTFFRNNYDDSLVNEFAEAIRNKKDQFKYY